MSKAKQPHTKRRKLPVSLTPVVFAFFMSAIMAVLMCLIITAVNQGFGDGYLLATVQAYQIAMPSAFICVMLVRPLVTKLVGYTVEKA
ncbi:DUF2798 domain-containing protein [uncultured Methylophaga sp.]|uniref:DUF2798 domain-containing protein n=1 Tax=uncultured Methylophaga sp. TaxID=285271 RepID=UPI00260F6349|nr:DUF2798 domain-containing protein [uncultured Methylophaga sp.]